MRNCYCGLIQPVGALGFSAPYGPSIFTSRPQILIESYSARIVPSRPNALSPAALARSKRYQWPPHAPLTPNARVTTTACLPLSGAAPITLHPSTAAGDAPSLLAASERRSASSSRQQLGLAHAASAAAARATAHLVSPPCGNQRAVQSDHRPSARAPT